MPKLPLLSGKELIKILQKIGFEVVRQRGSHVVLRKFVEGKKVVTVVPLHKEVKTGIPSNFNFYFLYAFPL